MSAWAATRRDYTADICRAFIKLGGCNRRSFSSSPSRWKSCYQILGVSRTATQAEIKRAYIELSKLEHPDRSTRSDAKQRFSNINAAHTVLRSKETRCELSAVAKRRYS
ncbi:hypothetical protein PILCRDRAFT_652062 [Piloderma croceum F 1598]|uniref:J domain-containing protein n=1 Tax=Piloderma croceum (strain F 1598) TaxID=765440 RepID=A0A0C3F904_PILCF|nr:hypothetical protein PILCRDRAFT_652062 [Piloderma croceum F 1598]